MEVVFLDDAPAWLISGIASLRGQHLGCHFDSLLQSLIHIEKSFGYDNPKCGLKSEGRPKAVALWINGGHGQKSKKVISVAKKDLGEYVQMWNVWWDGLQPAWRVRDADGYWSVSGEYGPDWDALDCRGQNGCLSVVAALYFWGTRAGFR
ncbi:hypothetical protein C8J57DRAFT_1087867 [Mycena rebaudengoi]|nr:hypothetical protein C8J57DRAFT_1087867 [Mycena rebaudengoi]